jgi:hypothetical protein
MNIELALNCKIGEQLLVERWSSDTAICREPRNLRTTVVRPPVGISANTQRLTQNSP